MNIITLLENNGYNVIKRGKNVAPGWVSIRCPFCTDASNHFGIRKKDLRCNCWKCGSHSVVKLIAEVENCTQRQARSIVKELRKNLDENELIPLYEEDDPHKHERRVPQLPPVVTPLPKHYRDYLRERNFNPNRLTKQYDLMACLNMTKYKFRIIIPMFYKHRMVSFTSRAIYNQMNPPYLHPEQKEVPLTPKQTVYNYDSFVSGTDMVIVEGPSDVWRWGKGAVATCGIQYSIEQIVMLRSKPIRNLFTFFDNERTAQNRARELIAFLKPVAKHVEQMRPDKKNDPGDLTQSEILYIKRHIGFNQ